MRLRVAMAMLLLASAGAATAAQDDARATRPAREIEALIDGLAGSGCDFERNGKRYGAAEAEAHLRRKQAWLDKRHPAGTAEEFIDRAASESSVSGEPYLVHCPGRPATESGIWFRALLARLRRQGGA